MRILRKKSGSSEDSELSEISEISGVTETVILSAKDQTTPASLVVDANGFVDVEKIAVEAKSKHDKVKSGQNSAPRLIHNLVSAVLNFARWPENALIQVYYESNFRNKVLNRFEWYRDFEGERELDNKLENLYGGTGTLFSFVKNNVLVSLILICVSFQLFASYLSNTAENYRYAKKAETVTEISQTAAVINAPRHSKVFNHCAVTDNLRQLYADTENGDLKNDVTAEVEGFIKVYDRSEIERWYADQQSKVEAATAQIQTTLPRISKYRDQITQEISIVSQQRADLQSQLDSITISGSQTMSDVNKSIKLRDRLAEIEKRMRTGPSAQTLSELDNQIDRLNAILSGQKTMSTPVSEWAKTTGNRDYDALVSSIRNSVDKDVDANIEQATRGTPDAKLYRLQIVVATLRNFGDLIGHLKTSANYFEVQVGNQQNISNRKIRELFEESGAPPDAKFLSYDNCLTALNTAPTKFTIH